MQFNSNDTPTASQQNRSPFKAATNCAFEFARLRSCMLREMQQKLLIIFNAPLSSFSVVIFLISTSKYIKKNFFQGERLTREPCYRLDLR